MKNNGPLAVKALVGIATYILCSVFKHQYNIVPTLFTYLKTLSKAPIRTNFDSNKHTDVVVSFDFI